VTQYSCRSPRRRDLVAAATDADGKPFLNGIDFLEVDTANRRVLQVHFVHAVPGQPSGVPDAAPPLTAANFTIAGGVRVTGVSVVAVTDVTDRVVTLETDSAGDFSTYALRLVTSRAVDATPAGFDPMLATVEFSFKVDCDEDLDCRVETECELPPVPQPHLDYLAKDYASFRRLILDRLAVIMPGWTERNPADVGVAVVELLAYVGDHLSYQQDAVATEAYLGTARRRPSVRRHARLVNYAMHDGANARAWIVVETTADRGTVAAPALPAGTVVLAAGTPGRPSSAGVAFETMHDLVTVTVARSGVELYTWGDDDCCLPAGATQATLVGSAAGLDLHAGDVLVLEEVLGPESGRPEDADPTHRVVVRLRVEPVERIDPLTGTAVLDVEWHDADRLAVPLCLKGFPDGAGGTTGATVARANVVLADHGLTATSQPSDGDLVPATVPLAGRYRPVLRPSGITQAAPYDDGLARTRPAVETLDPPVTETRPVVTLHGEGETWTPRRDLLGSDRFATEFVAESEDDGRVVLRFGDDVAGRRPAPGTAFTMRSRIGTGTAGNVGAEALSQLLVPLDGVRVRNPMAASGGTDPEPTRLVKLYAPQAFRRQERAVTADDYAEMAERHPDVQRAAATRQWTGSWFTMFVTVDRRGGAPVDDAFEADLRTFLEPFRMAGVDLEIDGPRSVALDLALTVCLEGAADRSSVLTALQRALGARRGGFFHPDNLTFGQPVYLSQLVARASSVPGVRAVVSVDRFQRLGQPARGEIDDGLLPIHRLEIARLDDDPSLPEHGTLELTLEGGR
jgi:hypothetical protein